MPMLNPKSATERQFNIIHRKTHRVIEQSFNILKSRWRILDHTGRTLCYALNKVAKITLSCCALHNICRCNGTPLTAKSDPFEAKLDSLFLDEANTASELSPSEEQQRTTIVSMINDFDTPPNGNCILL